MDKTINELRSYMIEPIMKKLYDIERRLDFLEMKVQTCEKKKIQKQEIKKQVLKKPHPKPKLSTFHNAFFINNKTKLSDVKLQWEPIDDVSRYIIEETCLSHGIENERWYRNRFEEKYLKKNFVYLPKFGTKFHKDWSTQGSKTKMTGMMGKFRWRYIPMYYRNGQEIEGIPSYPSEIWENSVIDISIGIEII